jgi:hypothetical protein
MEYGILIAESEDGQYQILGSVWSLEEAKELIENYFIHGPKCDCLAPDRFVIRQRGDSGFYTHSEVFASEGDFTIPASWKESSGN